MRPEKSEQALGLGRPVSRHPPGSRLRRRRPRARLVRSCERRSLRLTAAVTASATSGRRINSSSPPSSTPPRARSPASRRTSSGGTTPCGNGSDASSERDCRFPSQTRCTSCVCDSFSTTTINHWLSPVIEPLPNIKVQRVRQNQDKTLYFL